MYYLYGRFTMRFIPITLFSLMIAVSSCSTENENNSEAANTPETPAEIARSSRDISPAELLDWQFLGDGEVRIAEFAEAVFMHESDDSQGVTLVSPEIYGDNVIVKYQVKPMTYESVCVFIMSASDKNTGGDYTVPDDYNGNFAFWTQQDIQNYAFAFHNGAHDRKPFVIRNPGMHALYESDRHFSREVWHDIEIGRNGNTLWLNIDGESVINVTDANTVQLPGGRIGFRLRGTPGNPGAIQLKNVSIEE